MTFPNGKIFSVETFMCEKALKPSQNRLLTKPTGNIKCYLITTNHYKLIRQSATFTPIWFNPFTKAFYVDNWKLGHCQSFFNFYKHTLDFHVMKINLVYQRSTPRLPHKIVLWESFLLYRSTTFDNLWKNAHDNSLVRKYSIKIRLLRIALKGKMLKYVNHLMTQGGYPKWLKGVEITYTKGNCVIAH